MLYIIVTVECQLYNNQIIICNIITMVISDIHCYKCKVTLYITNICWFHGISYIYIYIIIVMGNQ